MTSMTTSSTCSLMASCLDTVATHVVAEAKKKAITRFVLLPGLDIAYPIILLVGLGAQFVATCQRESEEQEEADLEKGKLLALETITPEGSFLPLTTEVKKSKVGPSIGLTLCGPMIYLSLIGQPTIVMLNSLDFSSYSARIGESKDALIAFVYNLVCITKNQKVDFYKTDITRQVDYVANIWDHAISVSVSHAAYAKMISATITLIAVTALFGVNFRKADKWNTKYNILAGVMFLASLVVLGIGFYQSRLDTSGTGNELRNGWSEGAKGFNT